MALSLQIQFEEWLALSPQANYTIIGNFNYQLKSLDQYQFDRVISILLPKLIQLGIPALSCTAPNLGVYLQRLIVGKRWRQLIDIRLISAKPTTGPCPIGEVHKSMTGPTDQVHKSMTGPTDQVHKSMTCVTLISLSSQLRSNLWQMAIHLVKNSYTVTIEYHLQDDLYFLNSYDLDVLICQIHPIAPQALLINLAIGWQRIVEGRLYNERPPAATVGLTPWSVNNYLFK